MATKTVVSLVDDLTGDDTGDVATVRFGIDRVDYEIDLGEANQAALREALAKFVAVARRTGGRSTRRPGPRSGAAPAGTVTVLPAQTQTRTRSREENQQIREWAKSKGLDVAERGRIPAEVVQRYETERKRKQAG